MDFPTGLRVLCIDSRIFFILCLFRWESRESSPSSMEQFLDFIDPFDGLSIVLGPFRPWFFLYTVCISLAPFDYMIVIIYQKLESRTLQRMNGVRVENV